MRACPHARCQSSFPFIMFRPSASANQLGYSVSQSVKLVKTDLVQTPSMFWMCVCVWQWSTGIDRLWANQPKTILTCHTRFQNEVCVPGQSLFGQSINTRSILFVFIETNHLTFNKFNKKYVQFETLLLLYIHFQYVISSWEHESFRNVLTSIVIVPKSASLNLINNWTSNAFRYILHSRHN